MVGTSNTAIYSTRGLPYHIVRNDQIKVRAAYMIHFFLFLRYLRQGKEQNIVRGGRVDSSVEYMTENISNIESQGKDSNK